jgi:hypothetical protein
MLNKKALAASVSAPPSPFIEDVFSTYLYTGNGSTGQTITNDIDLSTKGGLVWIKQRNSAENHKLVDTARGATFSLESNTTIAQATETTGLTAFTSSGFSLGGDAEFNFNTGTYCSWTFRKQPKFFDMVTYTGNQTNRTIAHNLGSVPGMIIVICVSAGGYDKHVYHRSLANTEFLSLNTTNAKGTGANRWNSTTATATEFSLGTDTTVNATGDTFIAYLFAHNAGGFGTAGTDNVISCGSFTTDSSGKATVNLGYEPQYLLIKRANGADDWMVFDVMRGMSQTGLKILVPNSSDAENVLTPGYLSPTATGFTTPNSGILFSSNLYIYMAIRRPMKVPTTGTQVYKPLTRTGTGATANVTGVGFSPDLILFGDRTAAAGIPTRIHDRLRGPTVQLRTSQTDNEFNFNTSCTAIGMDGITLGDDSSNQGVNASGVSYGNSYFRRASGFFDIVCYTGTGSARTVAHNLTVVPELMIVKSRSTAELWAVYSSSTGNANFLRLNTNAAVQSSATMWDSTTPTSSVFSTANNTINASGVTHVAYLFATCAGVSKVGSYTGTGTTQTINCGFTGGARFVMVKATSTTGDWVVVDTARGLVSGNDPFLQLNSTDAEVTGEDILDPDSSGFVVNQTTESINASGVSYIFLAIA